MTNEEILGNKTFFNIEGIADPLYRKSAVLQAMTAAREEGRREALEALHKEYQKHHESFNQMVKGKILRSELYTMQTDEQILQSLQNKSK